MLELKPTAWLCCVPGQDVCLLLEEPPDSRYPKGYKDPLYSAEQLRQVYVAALRNAAKVCAENADDTRQLKFYALLIDMAMGIEKEEQCLRLNN